MHVVLFVGQKVVKHLLKMTTCSHDNCRCKNLYTDWIIGNKSGNCEDCAHPKTDHLREEGEPFFSTFNVSIILEMSHARVEIDGKVRKQQPGTTLLQLRTSYPACWLESEEEDYRNDSYVLENGKTYVLNQPNGKTK